MEYEEYWRSISKLTFGAEKLTKYEVLPTFALALSVKFFSNSEEERTFSLMNNIHQQKQRNNMSQDTLNCYLHVKSGVETKEHREVCSTCVSSQRSHCHCSYVKITESMRSQCRTARSKYGDSLKVNAEEKEIVMEDMELKRAAIKKVYEAKALKRKETLNKSSSFCEVSLLEPVYDGNGNRGKKVSDSTFDKNGNND